MPSNKASGADNQQERLKIIGWITGFVDGEGCFSVSIFRNPKAKTKLGWQVFPEFVVSQGEKSRDSLELIMKYFNCGSLITNKRKDNHHENMLKYCVRSIADLNQKIIPFFEENKLKTYKKNDFMVFKKIVRLVFNKKHLSQKGLEKIGLLISTMNRRKYPKFLESSETKRQSVTNLVA
jgi:hypothetical protein